jgi:hypothetical protein
MYSSLDLVRFFVSVSQRAAASRHVTAERSPSFNSRQTRSRSRCSNSCAAARSSVPVDFLIFSPATQIRTHHQAHTAKLLQPNNLQHLQTESKVRKNLDTTLPTTWTLPQNEMALARLLAASSESWDQQRRTDHGIPMALEMRASESVRYGGENDRMQKHPSGG